METLLTKLQTLFPGASNATLRKKLSHKRVLVNGQIEVSPKKELNSSDTVEVRKETASLPGGVQVLFEDSDIIVVIKPKGILTVDTPHSQESLHSLIKRNRDEPVIFPVQRLDKDTSGVLVFAKNHLARDGLKQQLFERTVIRTYRAVVHHRVQKDEATIELPLKETPNFMMEVAPGGMEAVTSYKVIRRSKAVTALELRLSTGRKNQIRVHMKAIGHPILGDEKYGIEDGSPRLMLHAHELSFIHPTKNKPLMFTAPLPKGF